MATQQTARDTLTEFLKHALWKFEGMLTSASTVGNPTFFEVGDFPWVTILEDNWQLIRTELDALLKHRDDLPNFQDISREQVVLTNDDLWKTYFFYAYGVKAEGNCRRCPETTRLLSHIPGLKTAFFSIFGPHKHLPPHRGPYKGVIRYHLGLKIPEPASECAIRVGDEVRHWQEGKSLIFDDTYDHEAWNHTGEDRVVLFVDFVRPMRFPTSVLNRVLLKAIQYSPFIMGAKGNYQAWEQRFEEVMNSK